MDEIVHDSLRTKQSAGVSDYGIKLYFPTDENKVHIRQMHLCAGQTVGTHSHKYEHYSILGQGSAIVDVDGEIETYHAPCVVIVKAHKIHKIKAITDITWFCVHATDELEKDEIEKVIIED